MNLGVGYQIIKDLAVTEANYDKLFRKMHEGMASQGSEVAPIKFDPYEVKDDKTTSSQIAPRVLNEITSPPRRR